MTSRSSWRKVAYPWPVTMTALDIRFAEEAGKRFEQAFVLCSFASELVGKANE